MLDGIINDNQVEIDYITSQLGIWNHIFIVKKEFYLDGYALYFIEKNLYPRLIVIYKSKKTQDFSLNSYKKIFDIKHSKEKFLELYSVKRIKNAEDLLKHLRKTFCGSDIITYAIQKYLKRLL